MSTKFAPRLHARAIWKSKSLKHRGFGALLEVDIDKICTTPARESDLEVKIVKNWRCRSIFGSWHWQNLHHACARERLQGWWIWHKTQPVPRQVVRMAWHDMQVFMMGMGLLFLDWWTYPSWADETSGAGSGVLSIGVSNRFSNHHAQIRWKTTRHGSHFRGQQCSSKASKHRRVGRYSNGFCQKNGNQPNTTEGFVAHIFARIEKSAMSPNNLAK